jgi:hypothetical protein
MKIHTTNYINTFIEVAEDCKKNVGEAPKLKGNKKSIAEMQFDLLMNNPYKFTSDDVFFQVYAERNDLAHQEYPEARKQYFSKGQPCFRASPLTKNYGWGVHSDQEGKIALYGIETEKYQNFVDDPTVKKVKAMRSSKNVG